ncbi:RES family NAD+ phosphorylase [Burkholderia sp. Ac-20345]|uniref:RES domain-containing protein n=1 Tax=Burkholderia sp. Ac-20345 TaxID=2703891 RepID=UPI00197B440E|nr:RES domain-containing protein [Burkholderia sp. Ac-20345]MBN3777022.1 RES family NAD+ phosphorylase [Burkholderia sp. Ac-20345]
MPRICHECVGEAYLSAEIAQSGEVGACDYCGQTSPSLSIDDLAERIETAFEDHYIRTPDQPNSWQERLLADKESDYDWDREGVPVLDAIADAALIPQGAAEDVLAILEERHGDFDKDAMGEESEFSSDSYYEERGPDYRGWQDEWLGFVNSLKTQARFFSLSAANHLTEVFGNIDKLKTRNARPVVVNAGPKTSLDHLYRARVFQTDGSLEEALRLPDRHLGSPPHNMARAGRMNAQGISVFYGATNGSVAIAEVRAPVGSRVAVAKFRITQRLRLLDLTALKGVHVTGSIFDASLKHRLERAAFLRTLGMWMARPVMPDDEAIDYLPTQAVADFLAMMNEPRLDGIVFPSAQTKAGRNVVLFHHAAKVAVSTLSKDAEITVNLGQWSDDGWEIDYSVLEEMPPQPVPKRSDSDGGILDTLSEYSAEPPRWDDDFREAALEIERDSVKVHHVNSVKVSTTSYSVHHFRVEKRTPKF